ncbi:MAG: cyclophilin-like fold protein [Paracoccus sp. (in: a-proteobacteria)]|nr:cyclophilin-like fold protein [Paracoccus sp. (in: a-proteobacteria)]
MLAPAGQALGIRCRFAGQQIGMRLTDNPITADLVPMRPPDMTSRDSFTIEQIAHLAHLPAEAVMADCSGEAPGDLCYFPTRGNLAFFYGDHICRRDLIRPRRIAGSVQPPPFAGECPPHIERVFKECFHACHCHARPARCPL